MLGKMCGLKLLVIVEKKKERKKRRNYSLLVTVCVKAKRNENRIILSRPNWLKFFNSQKLLQAFFL